MTSNEALADQLLFNQLAMGAVPSAFDAYLVNRGVKTLHLRMRAHMENALAVARWLEADHQRVERVLYPELESHPQHQIHKKQTTGMSGMVSFYLCGGLEESKCFLSSLKVGQSTLPPITFSVLDLHAGRVPGRLRVPRRAPLPDDARPGAGGRACQPGHHGQPDPTVGGLRRK
jgi:hypothetical protein